MAPLRCRRTQEGAGAWQSATRFLKRSGTHPLSASSARFSLYVSFVGVIYYQAELNKGWQR